ncbi:hypothetical protein R1sor_009709 [Riccia sorocarpa]|uniref:Transmembrane protein n=1 Tax=Riccia sorocarpa TaxID=122646 RepID=A0ABD3HW53_9MARC
MGKRDAPLPRREFSISSSILAVVFAYSASVQLNDIDWYFWLPLYSLACFVCLATTTARFAALGRILSDTGLFCSSILFLKVVLEGCHQEGVISWKKFISLDMNQRLVREKLGSLLVCVSMCSCRGARKNQQEQAVRSGAFFQSGRRLLAVITICLSVAYFWGRREGL